MRKTSSNPNIIARPGASAKGKIVAAGLRLADVAAAAPMAPSTLSDYLSGRLTSDSGRFSIFSAYCRLTNENVSGEGYDAFWGRRPAEEVA